MLVARRLASLSVIALPLMVALPATRGLAADLVVPATLTVPVTTLAADADQTLEADTQATELAVAEVECMAKVVMHEAGHEPHDGKVAVAQTLVNRVSRRLGGSICEVANQRGQFFNTAAYHPDRDGDGWADAVAVSRAVLSGAEDDVAPGAIFFRAASQPASGFFRSRQRIASVGSQIFYR